ncbi:hypothetical protein OAK74_00605 [bacterium]|nr:hypothetical protein [bacterium]
MAEVSADPFPADKSPSREDQERERGGRVRDGRRIIFSTTRGPPEGAANANANVTRITSADDSQWEAPR